MNHKSLSIIWQRIGLALSVALTPMLLTASAVFVQTDEADASSHREAPLISKDAYADNTDTYAFISPENPDNIVLAASWIPFEAPEGGPNYFEWDDNVFYEIHVDNNGDAIADFTYTLRSKTENANPATFLYNTGPIGANGENWSRPQRYTVTETSAKGSKELVSNVLSPPVNIGSKSTPDYEALSNKFIYTKNDGGDKIKLFAGQMDDAFWVDLQIFDLLTLRGQQPPLGYSLGNNIPVDSVAGFNVHSLVMEMPIDRLTQGDDPVLGVWATASRPSMRVLNGLAGLGTDTYSGDPVQVSRLGMPLTNEVVVPYALKDAFNTLAPSQDLAIYLDPTFGPILQGAVEDPEVGNLFCTLYGIPLPADSNNDCQTDVEIGTPRSGRGDIFDIFLTGMVLANEFTIQTANGPVTLPAGFNVNQPANVVPADMLRINTAIKGDLCSPSPSRLGVFGGDACGFPNGRRLADDIVEIELLAVAGAGYQILDGRDVSFQFNPALIDILDDGIDFNDKRFRNTFPYMTLAQSGQEHIHTNPVKADRETKSISTQISNRKDDAEELHNGLVRISSRDLELGQVSGLNQTVGVRFAKVNVPADATIVNAYIGFVAEGKNSHPATLTFTGEAAKNAAPYANKKQNISNRISTDASVTWSDVPAWNKIGEMHWTPNLASIVQEIISGNGWQSGNAVSFMVTGTGTRSAWSFDGKPGSATTLYVEYTTNGKNITASSNSHGVNSAVSSTILTGSNMANNMELMPDDDDQENANTVIESETEDAKRTETVFIPLLSD
ncbi:DUF4331 domain-containing protein [Chloroflexi bacterium TSY]|nr:DUF4331 domain-containing protein [Chloroflexi bacterium TSY]